MLVVAAPEKLRFHFLRKVTLVARRRRVKLIQVLRGEGKGQHSPPSAPPGAEEKKRREGRGRRRRRRWDGGGGG